MRFATLTRMALAGQLTGHAAVTRLANRVIRFGHRLIGFGVAPAESLPAESCPPALTDAAVWAEMASELRLRALTSTEL
ncbi:hypothetical protein AB0J72_21545 [Dactylosporangium sp. NPDC049742]|uniref:hypothetical protein n=1 Tax=Dactylosporangium sp. NPDC049742 TaxID=3154737 RepID=UPI0034243492